ncbi:hypothetical protein [Sphingomonas sp. T9W2]|uniref:hypothetical protein n=1 Tax=Sphingomonas sp. T9W2 TaxID=3143183 RepID=UPI0031F485A5
MNNFASNLIDALGGTVVVSRKTHAPVSTVHSWRERGLTASRLAHLKLVAEKDRVAIDWATGSRTEAAVVHCPTCEARAEHPSVRSCTAPDCPMRAREAA